MAYRAKKLKKDIGPKQKAQEAARLALDKKAKDVLILDMRKACGFCDYFVILSADSSRQIEAISKAIIEGLEKQNINLSSCEGTAVSNWMLLDYRDVVIHIFHPEKRAFYNLEKLWQETKRVRLPRHINNGPAKHRRSSG